MNQAERTQNSLLMRPAFSSTRQAAAFALLLLFLLAAPWLSAKKLLPPPKQTYSSESIRWEKCPWAQKFVFGETNDIDIAFLGSSHMGSGIDTPYIQQKLDEQLGRKSVVRTIWWTYPGFDALYFFTRDLLAHRHVKTLVFYDECSDRVVYNVHQYSPYWFRFPDHWGALSGLPFSYRAIYYYAAIIGTPRNLLESFVSNLPDEPHDRLTGPFAYLRAANPELKLGCLASELGFDPTYGDKNTNFTRYMPQNGVTPVDVRIFTPATATNFAFSGLPLPASQIYFVKQLGLLAKAHGCNLVALHLPLYGERTSPVITETRDWPDLMRTDVCLMGVPAGRLFAGLSESEIEQLYFDPGHLNLNGQKYFTSLVTPALIQYYESHSGR